jgi:cobaltochelatase CobT
MQSLSQIFRPRLLKENVDGEAVEWAVERLRKTPFARKILIVVSDGAPVDDTTLLFNGPEILDEHLCDTIDAIDASGDIEIYGVGLAHHMTRYYPIHCMIETPSDVGSVLLPFIGNILSGTPPSF